MGRFWIVEFPTGDGDRMQLWSREQIISRYFPYWSEQMRKVGKADQISHGACVEDWVAVNWAVPYAKP